jgi:hypothetical protein
MTGQRVADAERFASSIRAGQYAEVVNLDTSALAQAICGLTAQPHDYRYLLPLRQFYNA